MESLLLLSSNGHSTREQELNQNLICAETPFELFFTANEQINPAILLAEELMRKDIAAILDFDDLEEATEILAVAKDEIEQVEAQLTAISQTPGRAGNLIPLGF